jgi:hypothetical protein
MKVLPRRGQEENLNLQEDKGSQAATAFAVVILPRLMLERRRQSNLSDLSA